MWESHQELVGSFDSSLILEWTLALDTWEDTVKAEEEEELITHISDPDNMSTYAMVLDSSNPEEVGKEYGLEFYKKVWGDLSTQISITMPHILILGAFLESLSLRKYRAVERLKILYADVDLDRT